MGVSYNRKPIGNGINLTKIYDPKFKSGFVNISYISDFDKKSLAVTGLLCGLLITSNSKYKTRTALSQALEELYGSSIGVGSTVAGNKLMINWYVDFMSDKYSLDNENISLEASRILLDCLFAPDVTNGEFNKDYLELKRTSVIDQIKSIINDKRKYAFYQANKIIYENEPTGITESIEELEKATNEDLLKQLEYLNKNALIEVSICGGEYYPEAEELITESFAKLERNDIEDFKYRQNSPCKPEVRRVSETMDIQQAKIVMSFKSGYEDIYTVKLMCAMLGMTPFSKLMTNVREKLSLCYYCASSYNDLKGNMMVDCGVENDNIEKAEQEIIRQLELIAEGDFTEEELYNTKLFLTGAFNSNYDSLSAVNAWYKAQVQRETSYSPEEVNDIIMNIGADKIKECAGSFKLDTVYVLKAGDNDE